MAKKEEGISEKAVHTKGPWKIQEAFNRIETDREIIATVDGWELGNGKANSRLIAAAPDLLKHLEIAIQCCGCTLRQRESGHLVGCFAIEAKEIVAKACGEQL